MAANTVQVTFDCADPTALGRFWGQALGYVEQPPPGGFDTWDAFLDSINVPADERDTAYSVVDPDGQGPRLLFQRVPEGKTAKNRMHLDVNVGAGLEGDARHDRVRERAAELVAAGATLVEQRADGYSWWITMTDPEGNEFCLQ